MSTQDDISTSADETEAKPTAEQLVEPYRVMYQHVIWLYEGRVERSEQIAEKGSKSLAAVAALAAGLAFILGPSLPSGNDAKSLADIAFVVVSAICGFALVWAVWSLTDLVVPHQVDVPGSSKLRNAASQRPRPWLDLSGVYAQLTLSTLNAHDALLVRLKERNSRVAMHSKAALRAATVALVLAVFLRGADVMIGRKLLSSLPVVGCVFADRWNMSVDGPKDPDLDEPPVIETKSGEPA